MPLSGHEKAAVFLISLGEEIATEVLKALDPSDVRTIMNYMKRLRKVNQNQIEEVLKEAGDIIAKGDIPISGIEFTRTIMSRGIADESLLPLSEMDSIQNPLEILEDVDVKTLVPFLKEEHPQVIALFLSLMEPRKAAEVIGLLPDKMKADVAIRIATMERIPEEAVEELREVLKSKVEISKSGGKSFSGKRTIAEILNHCDKSIEEVIFEKIEEQDSELAESIRENMFLFEDLLNVDDRGIQLILKEVSTEELSIALKTASDALKEKIFKNMSQRAAQILKEEMETRGPVRVSDVEKAQQNIIKVARKLEQEGRIVIGKGEKLVV